MIVSAQVEKPHFIMSGKINFQIPFYVINKMIDDTHSPLLIDRLYKFNTFDSSTHLHSDFVKEFYMKIFATDTDFTRS